VRGPSCSQVSAWEREGGAWRLYLACGHSVYSAVPPASCTEPVFCSYCFLEAGRRAQAGVEAELRRLSDACE